MEEHSMTFMEHLDELRSRIIKIAVAVGVAFAVAWTFHEEVFHFLARPVMKGLQAHGIQALQALNVTEGISVYLKASAVAALFVASPWVIWQIWAFVTPALHKNEKRLVAPTAMLVAGFFILGVTFCYTIFLPIIVEFLTGFAMSSGDMVLAPTVQSTFGMAMSFLLIFGLVFELPLVMLFLGLLNIVSPKFLWKYSRHFIVVAFVIGAIFTPPEPVSQTLMAVPLCLLYMLGILLAWAGKNMGGASSRRRAILAVILSFLIFAAGIIITAWQWNKDPAPKALPVSFNASFVLLIPEGSETGQVFLDKTGDGQIAKDNGPTIISVDPSGRHITRTGSAETASTDQNPALLWPASPEWTAIIPTDVMAAMLTGQCAGKVSPWTIAQDKYLSVRAVEASPGISTVVFSTSDGTALNVPASADGSEIGQFISNNKDDAYASARDKVPGVSVVVSTPRAAEFFVTLVSGAAGSCR
jgi:sec-independent protein translocase protein TatC